MQSFLSFLVIVGLLAWGFLLYEKDNPVSLFSRQATTRAERCADIGYDVEGDRTLSYGDRIKEIVRGCW